MSELLHIHIGYYNRIDAATLSGGSWVASLPLTNLQDPGLYKPARSSGDATAATQFDADLGAAYLIQTVALVNHNLTKNAVWRVRAGNDAAFATTLYDSGNVSPWALDFDEGVEWEDTTWWAGLYSADEWTRNPWLISVVFSAAVSARYIRVEIIDTDNPESCVQIGRAFIGAVFRPEINASYGLNDQWIDTGSYARGVSGALHVRPGRRYRRVTFSLDWLKHDEDADLWWELQRYAGTTGEVLYLPSDTSKEHTQRFGFLGHMRELGPLEFRYYIYRSGAAAIEEIL